MNRLLLITCLAAALCGCSNDPAGHHAPPKDPADYHGVPTDDRPPSMLIEADPQAAPQAKPQ